MRVGTLKMGRDRRDSTYILQIFINNSFESKMYLITLLLIFSGVAVNSPTGTEEMAKKEIKEVANAESEVAKGIHNFEVTHLGTDFRQKKASTTSYNLVQDYKDKPKAPLNPWNSLAEDTEGNLQGSRGSSNVLDLENSNSVESKASNNWDGFENVPLISDSDSEFRNIYGGYSSDSSVETQYPLLRRRSHLKKVKNGAIDAVRAAKEKQLTEKEECIAKAAALGIFIGIPTVITLGLIEQKKHLEKLKSGKKSKSPSDEPVLTSDNAKSSILNNDASEHNTGTQPSNKESPSVATSPRKPEETRVQASDSVIKHSSLNIKHIHTSKQTTIVYIVIIVAVALLLIVAGIFILKIQQVKKDLYTDMNQYYANDLTKANSIPIYPNASWNQRNNLI